MLTRLIGGNRVITLGTAIEQNFLTNDNYGYGFYHRCDSHPDHVHHHVGD